MLGSWCGGLGPVCVQFRSSAVVGIMSHSLHGSVYPCVATVVQRSIVWVLVAVLSFCGLLLLAA